MFRVYSGSLRLAFALACVGASVLLAAQLIDLLPDPRQQVIEGRRRECEAISICAASMVRQQQWKELQTILHLVTERNPQLYSIGVRKESGELTVRTAEHEARLAEMEQQAKAGISVPHVVEVPIMMNKVLWGRVEFVYESLDANVPFPVTTNPLINLFLFFLFTAIILYTYFIGRVMRVLDSTQVVPERVRQAFDTFAEGLLVLDEQDKIILANQAFADIVQVSTTELVGKSANQLAWDHSLPANSSGFPWSIAKKEATPQTEILLLYQLEDGGKRVLSSNAAPIIAASGNSRGTMATFRDVTHIEEHRAELEKMLAALQCSRDEIKRKNLELEILATQDALTGCLNRRAFFERFDREWNAARDNETKLACLMFDNDHFKSINDTYGHHTGDEVLRAVSSLLKQTFQKIGLVCRYGGEEFCVVLPNTDGDQAALIAEEARKAIEQIRLPEPAELRISASIGVSDLSHGAVDPQDLINQADICLYVAKRQGRNRVIQYRPEYAEEKNTAEVATAKQKGGREENSSSNTSIPFPAVTALVSALSFRDLATAEHSRRVADLAVLAAGGLMNQRQTYVLEIAALLHDIGKIGVPDDILLKPGRLTEDEWKIMGQHDRIGVEIVEGTFNCPELTDIVGTHHAFFGGDARDPHLPTGADIPLGSRILTICDTYDAIVSDRPYRPGRSHEVAVAELRRCAGTQFDPEVVEHFIRRIEERGLYCPIGGYGIEKSLAQQFGAQIERIAQALDAQDFGGLQSLAGRLSKTASQHGVTTIADAASKVQATCNNEDRPWMEVLAATSELLELCRSTQSAFLADATKSTARKP